MTVIWQNSQLAVSTCKVATGHNTERHGVNTVSKSSLGSSPVNGQHNSSECPAQEGSHLTVSQFFLTAFLSHNSPQSKILLSLFVD